MHGVGQGHSNSMGKESTAWHACMYGVVQGHSMGQPSSACMHGAGQVLSKARQSLHACMGQDKGAVLSTNSTAGQAAHVGGSLVSHSRAGQAAHVGGSPGESQQGRAGRQHTWVGPLVSHSRAGQHDLTTQNTATSLSHPCCTTALMLVPPHDSTTTALVYRHMTQPQLPLCTAT